MTRPKLCLGIPYYGAQDAQWWKPLAEFTSLLHKLDIDFVGIATAGGMMADMNRNNNVQSFLETEADWLFWIDADNNFAAGGLKRLLDINKTLVSGVYFSKRTPYHLIAYYRLPNMLYRQLTVNDYERGEIIPVDAAGCGGLLTHRSVYEDMLENFVVLQDSKAATRIFHKDDIIGEVRENGQHPQDGKVIKGQYRERVRPVVSSLKDRAFPWFALEHGRTEDLIFFENAARVGHKCWLDTSVEGGHLVTTKVTGEIARKQGLPKVVERTVIEVPRIPDGYELEELDVRSEITDS